jgi:FkbM family methyltransferase
MLAEGHTRLTLLHDLLQPERLIEIVDVGANPISAPDYQPLFAAGLARVTGFEPQEAAFKALEPMQSETARFFPFAVGDGTDKELKVCKTSGFTSLLEPNIKTFDFLGRYHRAGRVLERIEMPTKRLDDIDGLGQVDFLKIDIQGGEVDVFNHAREALKSCAAVMTEVAFVPLYEDQPLVDTQMAVMREQGFQLHKFMFVKSIPISSKLAGATIPNKVARNQLIDGDAVFIKDLFDLGDAPDERLKHLALLAEGCFRSPDLVVRCLSLLVERGTIAEADCAAYLTELEHA